MGNIDFNGHIDDENRRDYEAAEELYCFEDYLTVKALLCMHFGDRRGNDIYGLLYRMAKKIAEEMGGTPGLILNDDGGEFVSFSNDQIGDEAEDSDEDDNDVENWDA